MVLIQLILVSGNNSFNVKNNVPSSVFLHFWCQQDHQPNTTNSCKRSTNSKQTFCKSSRKHTKTFRKTVQASSCARGNPLDILQGGSGVASCTSGSAGSTSGSTNCTSGSPSPSSPLAEGTPRARHVSCDVHVLLLGRHNKPMCNPLDQLAL